MQFFKCFSCDAGGNVFTFLMKHEKMTFPEAVKFLAERCNVTIPEAGRVDKARDVVRDELR